MKVAGYGRVSTREQGDSGLSLTAQQQRLAGEAVKRGWELVTFVPEIATGRNMRRGGLAELLRQLEAGEYEALVVTRLDRLTRSLLDFARIMEAANDQGWSLVVLDSGVDMTTPWGRAMAGMAAVWAQLMVELISENTREGLAVARAQGRFRPGEHQRYGRTPVERAVIGRILEMATTQGRRRGMTHREIADTLNLEGVATPNGGSHWHHRTVGRIIARERAE